MNVRYVLAGLLGAALLARVAPPARAEFPDAVEARLRAELSRVLTGANRELSFRACLLTDNEALVEVTVHSGPDQDAIRDARAVEQSRAQVAELVAARFPGMRLSELSTFRLAIRPRREPQMIAMGPQP